MTTVQLKTCDVCDLVIEEGERHVVIFVDVEKRHSFDVHERCSRLALGEKILVKVLPPKDESK